jgi:hypothetical protein
MTSLPEPPNRRRIVLVLNPVAYRAMDFEDVREIDERTDIAVLDAVAPIEDPVTHGIERQGLLVPGNVLVQNPFRTDRYAEIREATDLFALDKSVLFARLCQLLGAEHVIVEKVEDRTSKTSVKVGGGYDDGASRVSAQVSTTAAENFARKLHFSDDLAGGAADIQGANRFLIKHGLDADPMMSSLIEARSDAANNHRTRMLSIDLSTETDRNLNIIADVGIPTFFSVKVDISRTVRAAAHYRVLYQVDFPGP